MSGSRPASSPSSSIHDLARRMNAASAAALAAEIGSIAALPVTDAHGSPAPPSPMDVVDIPQPTEAVPGLQLLQTLEGHTDRVWAVAWSPDGTMLASCSGDKHVRIWTRQPAAAADDDDDDDDGQWACTSLLEEQSRTVRALAWSPNGRCLATASFDATTVIWEGQGGEWECVATLEGHENEVKGVAWASSGGLLATCSRDRSVWIWESLPGHEFECVDVKQGHSQDVKAVRWHPGGEILVSASYDDTMKLWVDSGDDWECAQTLSGPGLGHSSTVWDVAFNREGTCMVSCSDDKTLKLWSCGGSAMRPRWKLLSTLEGKHERTIFSVDWSAGGAIATGSGDNSIRVFLDRTATSEGRSRKAGAPAGEGAAAMMTEGAEAAAAAAAAAVAASAAASSTAEGQSRGAWSPTESGLVEVVAREDAHGGDVNCVRWHPADPTLLASAGDDGTVRLWRLMAPAGSLLDGTLNSPSRSHRLQEE